MFKKIILFLLLSLLNIGFTFCNENPQITNIIYKGNLNSNSIVEISGINLSNCKNLIIGDKEIPISNQTNSLITYIFGNSNIYDGKININCDNQILTKEINFPYIKKTILSNSNPFNREITINGVNFGNSGIVALENGTLSTYLSNDRIISGAISENITSNDIYISNNGLLSNIVKLDLDIPKIDYVTSSENFLVDSEIIIHGKNLNNYSNSKLFINDMPIEKFKFKNNNLFLNSGNELGTKNIKINSNGIFSNTIEIKILSNKPYIKSIKQKEKKIIEDSETRTEKSLVINGDNFGNDLNNIKLFNNGNIVNIDQILGKTLIIYDYNLKGGNNIFQIEINGNYSNTLNIITNYRVPSIISLQEGKIDGENRNIFLNIADYQKETDNFYLDGTNITPISCTGNKCRFIIKKSITNGVFSCSNGYNFNENTLEFNLELNEHPYIKNIVFSGELKNTNKFTINGNNFLDSNITQTNLFSKKQNNKLDLIIKNSYIEGRFPYDYNDTKKSSITITKEGKSSTISFIGNEVKGKTIKGGAFIKNIIPISKNKLIKAGNKIKITGYGFNNGDLIVIGTNKIPLFFENKTLKSASFTIPIVIKNGLYNIHVENIYGNISNSLEMLIIPNNYENNIFINSKKIDNLNFKNNTNISSNKIYELTISNKIEDIIIKKIAFIISNYDDNDDDLGSFIIKLNNKNIGTQYIKTNGKLIFNNQLILKKSNSDYILTLYKDSIYPKKGNYDVIFDINTINAINKNNSKKVDNFNFESIEENQIKILNDELLNCIDTKQDNTNCHIFNGISIIKEETTQEETTQENNSQENNSQENNSQENNSQENNSQENNSQENNSQENNFQEENRKKEKINKNFKKFYDNLSLLPKSKQLNYLLQIKYELLNISKKIKDKNKQDNLKLIYNNINSHYYEIKN